MLRKLSKDLSDAQIGTGQPGLASTKVPATPPERAEPKERTERKEPMERKEPTEPKKQ
jgi:hypothetical protein